MKFNKKTYNKGITLIALVITIIVLLLLAGVSISTLTGDNGIITQANNAKVQAEIAEEKEILNLATISVLRMEKDENENITKEKMDEELGKLSRMSYTSEVIENGLKITLQKAIENM